MGMTQTVISSLRSRPVKIVYRCIKGICVGQPAIRICAKELVACVKEIDAGKLGGPACKRAMMCLLPVSGFSGFVLIAELYSHPVSQTVAKYAGNGFGLIVSGPAYGIDSALGWVETVVFGETVPIVTDHKLFLFGNPLDDIV